MVAGRLINSSNSLRNQQNHAGESGTTGVGDYFYVIHFLYPMHHIMYLSRAARPMSDEELARLLQQARRANAQRGVTGALVYGNGQFMQIIEGEEETLAALYARLYQDARHGRIVKFADKPIAERTFTNWSMAFQPVSAAEFTHLAGYVAPADLAARTTGLAASENLLLQMVKQLLADAPAG